MNILFQLYLWLMTMFGVQAPYDGLDTVQTGERQTMNATASSSQSKKAKKALSRTSQIYNGF